MINVPVSMLATNNLTAEQHCRSQVNLYLSADLCANALLFSLPTYFIHGTSGFRTNFGTSYNTIQPHLFNRVTTSCHGQNSVSSSFAKILVDITTVQFKDVAAGLILIIIIIVRSLRPEVQEKSHYTYCRVIFT